MPFVSLPDGGYAHIRMSRPRQKRCPFCREGWVSRLCDFPIDARTCDAGMCDECRTAIAHGVDYCPNHKRFAELPMEAPAMTTQTETTACTWQETKKRICGKISLPGKTLCPKHEEMRKANLKAELDKSYKGGGR